ncbi:MAG: glycoside hydrolase family 3 protein [Oscillospiraceae bacterium]
MNLQGNPFYLNDKQTDWVESTLSALSAEQKIGQLFCVMGGDYGAEELNSLVSDRAIGGVLFRPAPAAQIEAALRRLSRLAPVPLLKAANLEEGGVGAVSDGTFFGWPMTVAAADDDSVMEKFAHVCAGEGASVGVNWTFSPVCDLDLNFRNPITNVRTCGSDPARVAALCETYVKTVQSDGVAACAKHFPGDGVDFRDQHLHPTYNSLSADEWDASYGAVYQRLIGAGLLSVMAAHICQPALSMRENPALTFADCLPGSLSPELLTGVLRGRLGFNGLIVTDATIMAGFTQTMPRREAIPAALMAGVDMFVFSTDIYEDMRYVSEALGDGRLTAARLDEAVTRVLALKAWTMEHSRKQERAAEALAWRDECADKCVTMVKNTQDVLPITPEKFPLVRLITIGNDAMPEGSMTELTEDILRAAGFQTERFDIEREELHGTSALTGRRLTLYLCHLEHASNQTALRIFWARKHALDVPRHVWEEPSIFVSFSNPYHLQDVPRVKTYINAYSCHESTVRAVLEKLMGRSAFRGVSPVDAFCGLPDARL